MVKQVRDRFGEIQGVIHTAGVPGAGLVQLKTPEMANSVLNPKVKGTLVLDAVLKDVKLDFLVLFSSVGAIYGGFGQVDYCAANAFLDAFAHYQFFSNQRRTVSINWDWWQWDSWQEALLSFAPEMQAEVKQMREKYGITFSEGIDAFDHILSSQLSQVIVSTVDFQSVIEEHQDFALASLLAESEESGLELKYSRPNLKTAYVAPNSEIEQRIAQRYQKLLGIEQVGIHDSFFDLGGNSLTGIQMISQLRQDFNVEIPISVLFEAPTVAELALNFEKILIQKLESLTEEEAEELVSDISSK
jgi:acyl carrier protein